MLSDEQRLLLEALELQRQVLVEIRDLLYQCNWICGCGHVNGVNLPVCAQCGRSPA